MNAVELPREDDLSALAWVHTELRRSLEAAHKALRRHLKEAEAAAGSDVDAVDPGVLRSARAQIHQGVGALELIGQTQGARLLRASEAAVQRLIARPRLLDAAAVETIERASFALLDFLARQLAGKPLSAVSLFPQYRAVQQLAGADRVHPADLAAGDWQWRTLAAAAALPPMPPRAADEPARNEMESLVLTLMRQPDRDTFQRVSNLCAELAAGALHSPGGERLATLWQLAAAVFEAQAAALLASDVYTKRLASRLLAQLRAGARGSHEPSERLAQDLVFFCAQARAPEPPDVAPRLAAVRQAWQLDATAPVDYETARLGRFDPVLLATARKRLAGAKDIWSAVAGGELQRISALPEHFALVGDSIQRLFPAGEVLAGSLQEAAGITTAADAAPAPTLAMEVATSLLYLDASIEDGEFDHPELGTRVQRLATRIDEVRAGADPHPLEPWMEELYRRVSDRQTLGSVVHELRASLSEVEKQIDQFFREPSDAKPLITVPGQLAAMRGVLSVLGLDQASQAVLLMRDDVDALLQTAADPERPAQTGTFDRLADNLGALSFLIDMLSVQPQMAKALFRLDPDSGRFSAVMGQAERPSAFTPLDEPAAGVAKAEAADTLDQPPLSLDGDRPGETVGSEAAPDAVSPLAAETRPESASASTSETAPTAPPGTAAAATDNRPLIDQALELAQASQFGDLPDDSLAQRIDALAQQAVAADSSALARALNQGQRALGGAADAEARRAARVALAASLQALQPVAPEPPPAPAPTPIPPSRPTPVDGTGLEDDVEMREIFLEEAREVVADAHAAIERLTESPDSASEMTAVRRAFHTLKGSSRMVGLREFGDGAWACEQLYNARLASQPRMDTPLRQFTAEALAYLGDWTEAIAAGRDDGHRAPPLAAAADALRLEDRRIAIAPAVAAAGTEIELDEETVADLVAAPADAGEPAAHAEGLDAEVLEAEVPAEDTGVIAPEVPAVAETFEKTEGVESAAQAVADADPLSTPEPLAETREPVEEPVEETVDETAAESQPEATEAITEAVVDTVAAPSAQPPAAVDAPPLADFADTLPPTLPSGGADETLPAEFPSAAEAVGEVDFAFDLGEGEFHPDTDPRRPAAASLTARIPDLPTAADLDLGLPAVEGLAADAAPRAAGDPAAPTIDTFVDGHADNGLLPTERTLALPVMGADLELPTLDFDADETGGASADYTLHLNLSDLDLSPGDAQALPLEEAAIEPVGRMDADVAVGESAEDAAPDSADDTLHAEPTDPASAETSSPGETADLPTATTEAVQLDDAALEALFPDSTFAPTAFETEPTADASAAAEGRGEGAGPSDGGPGAEASFALDLDLGELPALEPATDDKAEGADLDDAAVAAGATATGDDASTAAAISAPIAQPGPQPSPEGGAERDAQPTAQTEAAPAFEPALDTDAAPLLEEEPVKLIGPLRISIPLFNIFLNEADEQSRRLVTELAEWSLELPLHALPESTVSLAHSLAGSSATVGYADLSALARALEHALMRAHAASSNSVDDAGLFNEAAEEIRRLLHQFAAGFLHEPASGLLQRLLAFEPQGESEDGLEALAPPDATPALEAEAEAETLDDVDLHAPYPTAPVAVSDFVPLAPEAELPLATGASADAFDDDEDIDAVDQIDTELFPIFEEEAEELLPQLQARLRDWLDNPGDDGAAAACMRTLHTLKGGARLAGAMRLGEMAHRLETAIERQLARPQRDATMIEPMLARADAMSTLFEQLRAGPTAQDEAITDEPAPLLADAAPEPAAESAPPSVATGAAQPGVGSGATSTEQHPASRAEPEREPEPAEPSEPGEALPAVPAATAEQAAPAPAARPSPAIDWSRFLVDSAAPVAAPAEPGGSAIGGGSGAVRVRAALLDRLVNHAGEVAITRARIDAEMRTLQGSLGELTDSLERMRRQLRDIELQAETQMSSRMEAAKAASQAFDPLEMDRFTRLQELTRFMAESVNDVATLQRGLQRTLQSTEDELAAQARLTRELQDDLLRTRMVEFESLADRLYRTVRQAGKDSGKTVRLDIVGGAIEIDRGVLERMTAPFEHLLRNAVAHGIEPPEQRTAGGKDASGRIVVSVAQAGNEVAVEFADDGAGLDLARIRERGIARGLIAADGQASDAELAQLIFKPGFSTAEALTELAGRGVGMDVVRAEVTAMGGRIETTAAAGQGTRFRLLLPLTTAVTQVVMLRCGALSVAVPSTLVELVRRVPQAEVEAAYTAGSLAFDSETVPFYWLAALLGEGLRGEAPGRSQAVVIVRSAAQRVALHVEDVTANQEVVVKNVGPQLARVPGLVGVTLLPSGAAALIYNPVALGVLYGPAVQTALARLAATPADETSVAAAAPAAVEEQRAPLVLVVDDSLTVRRVTQRLLLREGYRVTTAKDGLEALERLADERPAVLLSDIEMPRMDGFDLLRNVRADERLAGLPVVMITSRTAQKHRDLAAELGADHYLGKPYGEDELLGLIAQHVGATAPDIVA